MLSVIESILQERRGNMDKQTEQALNKLVLIGVLLIVTAVVIFIVAVSCGFVPPHLERIIPMAV